MEVSPAYHAGLSDPMELLLERYLPPYRYGMLTNMLHEQQVEEGWVLDPLGSTPLSAIELAQSGFRVFVASNNPILTRLYQVYSQAPRYTDVQAAISEFAALRRGADRLEVEINRRYLSSCPKCDHPVTPVFLWKKNESTPYAKEINCPACARDEVFEVDEQDRELLSRLGNVTMHRARALQRVSEQTNPPPPAVAEVMQAYLPRSISVLTTLLNKLEGLNTEILRKQILEALLIQTCDYGNMMWPVTSGTSRPKQIYTPADFREYPLWRVIEEQAELLTRFSKPVPLSIYPQIPPSSGGICLYPYRIGHAQDLDSLPEFQAVATVLPRPNQALWTLSAVWAGWLWGPEAAARLKGALERRRYDWLWHTNALKRLFRFTESKALSWIAVAPELSASYTFSFLSAAESSGYRLQNFAYDPQTWTAQFYWRSEEQSSEYSSPGLPDIETYLAEKGTSASYQELLILYQILQAQRGKITLGSRDPDPNRYNIIQNEFEEEISEAAVFEKIDEDQLEYGNFWLTKPPARYRPIEDQIELQAIRYLQKQPETDLDSILSWINAQQLGYLPADIDYLKKVLSSYCEITREEPKKWSLRSQEITRNRQSDILSIQEALIQLGSRLGLLEKKEPPIQWKPQGTTPAYRFFVTASSIISRFYEQLVDEPGIENVVVYPGSRAVLLHYKFRQDPVFATKMRNVHFLKFRHIRSLNQASEISMDSWLDSLGNDPPLWQDFDQPRIFS